MIVDCCTGNNVLRNRLKLLVHTGVDYLILLNYVANYIPFLYLHDTGGF